MKTTANVSIIVPAYKTTAYIGETLDSILAQTRKDYEIIVVNDGCPDTLQLERKLEKYQSQIRYIKQENRGLAGARNTGLAASRAPYVALLDSDDIWEPNYLAVQMEKMEADPTIDILYCDAAYFGNAAEEGRRFMNEFPSKGEVTLRSLITSECSVFISVLAKRSVIETVGGFDENLRRGSEDIDVWLRVTHAGGKISYHRKPLVRYRRRHESLSADREGLGNSYLIVLAKIAALKLSAEERRVVEEKQAEVKATLAWNSAQKALRLKDAAGAVEYYRQANQYFRKPKLSMMVWALRLAPQLVFLFKR